MNLWRVVWDMRYFRRVFGGLSLFSLLSAVGYFWSDQEATLLEPTHNRTTPKLPSPPPSAHAPSAKGSVVSPATSQKKPETRPESQKPPPSLQDTVTHLTTSYVSSIAWLSNSAGRQDFDHCTVLPQEPETADDGSYKAPSGREIETTVGSDGKDIFYDCPACEQDPLCMSGEEFAELGQHEAWTFLNDPVTKQALADLELAKKKCPEGNDSSPECGKIFDLGSALYSINAEAQDQLLSLGAVRALREACFFPTTPGCNRALAWAQTVHNRSLCERLLKEAAVFRNFVDQETDSVRRSGRDNEVLINHTQRQGQLEGLANHCRIAFGDLRN